MKFLDFLNEAKEWDRKSPEYKLFMRFMNVRNKADKMHDQMWKMADEVAKIQKQMKKHGMDELLDHLDRPIFNVNADDWDTIWSMFSKR